VSELSASATAGTAKRRAPARAPVRILRVKVGPFVGVVDRRTTRYERYVCRP
jgi:hypothetical protein